MSNFSLRVLPLLAALSLTVVLTGCVVARPGPYRAGIVLAAPPATRVEYYGAPPYPGYFWIAGFWRWGPRGYVWVRGRWSPPRPGYRWVPRHWVHVRHGWRAVGGYWRPLRR
jgi:hypothetical protein